MSKQPCLEDISTEEVLAQLGEAETAIRDNGLTDTMVGSLDVRALYSSINHEASAEAVAKFIMDSQVDTVGVDWRAAQVYVASNLSEAQVKDQGLKGIVPRRLKARGCRPGPKTRAQEQKTRLWSHSCPSRDQMGSN